MSHALPLRTFEGFGSRSRTRQCTRGSNSLPLGRPLQHLRRADLRRAVRRVVHRGLRAAARPGRRPGSTHCAGVDSHPLRAKNVTRARANSPPLPPHCGQRCDQLGAHGQRPAQCGFLNGPDNVPTRTRMSASGASKGLHVGGVAFAVTAEGNPASANATRGTPDSRGPTRPPERQGMVQ